MPGRLFIYKIYKVVSSLALGVYHTQLLLAKPHSGALAGVSACSEQPHRHLAWSLPEPQLRVL